jgi:hypothetical protein
MKTLKLASTAVILCVTAFSFNQPLAQARGLGSRGSDYAGAAAWGALYRMYMNSRQSDSYDYSGYSDNGISSSPSRSRNNSTEAPETPQPRRLTEAERIFGSADDAAAKLQGGTKDVDCAQCNAPVSRETMKIQTTVEELADHVSSRSQETTNADSRKVVVHMVEVKLNLADTKYRVACKITEDKFAELHEINFEGLPVATFADRGNSEKIQTPDFMGAETIAKMKATPRSEDAKRFLEQFKSLILSEVATLHDPSTPGKVTASLTKIAGPGGITGPQLKGLIETFIPAASFQGCLILEPKTNAVMYVYPYKP